MICWDTIKFSEEGCQICWLHQQFAELASLITYHNLTEKPALADISVNKSRRAQAKLGISNRPLEILSRGARNLNTKLNGNLSATPNARRSSV